VSRLSACRLLLCCTTNHDGLTPCLPGWCCAKPLKWEGDRTMSLWGCAWHLSVGLCMSPWACIGMAGTGGSVLVTNGCCCALAGLPPMTACHSKVLRTQQDDCIQQYCSLGGMCLALWAMWVMWDSMWVACAPCVHHDLWFMLCCAVPSAHRMAPSPLRASGAFASGCLSASCYCYAGAYTTSSMGCPSGWTLLV
jgi:hypothetical protein